MAVQLPNFLGVPVREPDYSALGNIFENYYAGKNLPRQDMINEYAAKGAPLDYLMKQVQAELARPKAEQELKGLKLGNQIKQAEADYALPNAEQFLLASKLQNALRKVDVDFARPKAEQTLAGLKLGNQSTSLSNRQAQMTIERLQKELAKEAELQALIRSGGVTPPVNESTVRQQQNDKALQDSLAGVMGHQAMKNQPTPMAAPLLTDHPANVDQVQQIDAGTPSLYPMDKIWEERPDLRASMKKDGREKTVTPTYDKKTGQTRIETKWPSGRVTVKIIAPIGKTGIEEIPLTAAMKTKHQNVISSVDTVLPVLDKIMELKEFPRYSLPLVGSGNQLNKYDALVNESLDSLIGALGVPRTNEGLESVKKQIQIGRLESERAYKKRMKEFRQSLLNRKAYSSKEIKKPVDYGAEASTDSITEADPLGLGG